MTCTFQKLMIGFASVAAMGMLPAQGDRVGWISPLTTTTYSWSETANWENGVINGIFGSNLVGSGKTYPTICLDKDVDLSAGLEFLYSNSEQYFTLRGDGVADRTVTLGGDVIVSVTGNGAKGSITLGSGTANQNLHLNLNGDRQFVIDTLGLKTNGRIEGGNLTVTGDSSASHNLTLAGQAGCIDANAKATFTTCRGLYIYEKDQYISGCQRAGDVRLESGFLVYEGTGKGSATSDSIGKLTLAPGKLGGGIVRFQNYGSSGYKGAHLTIDEIAREQGMILDVHSGNGILGAGAIGDDGSVNVTVTKGVTAIGTGAFGTVTAPVVPWARGSTATAQTTDQRFDSLVTYDLAKGFRLLNTATECEKYDVDYTGPVLTPGANVNVVPAGTVEFTGDNTVNSILLTSTSTWKYLVATNGTLSVSSGAVDMSSGQDNLVLNANLDFGVTTGYITSYSQKRRYLQGSISGSAGVVYADQIIRARSAGAPLSLSARAQYTGNTYVNGYVAANTDEAVPHGEGKGDFYVNGRFQPTVSNGVTVNGLYGYGKIDFAQSYTSGFTFGDNNADGNFKGEISCSGANKFPVRKIGSGCQRLGDISIASPLAITAGTAIFDGTVTASSVTIADGAAFGGSGTFETEVQLKGNNRLVLSVSDRKLPCLTLNGGFSTDSVVTVEADSADWKGTYTILKAPAGMIDLSKFKKGTNVVRLALSADGTELLATKVQGLVMIFR